MAHPGSGGLFFPISKLPRQLEDLWARQELEQWDL